MADPPQRSYSRDDMMEILRRASDGGEDEGIRHEDLVEAAREAGLDPDSVERAAAELSRVKDEARVRDKLRARRRALFRTHLTFYGFINGLLVLLNLLTTAFPWALVPLVAWGFWLALHGLWARRDPSDAAVERVSRRERRRREAVRRREAKKAARQERSADERARRARRDKVGKELELAMEEGVNALLAVAAKKIEAAARAADPPPDTEFNRYVAREKKGQAKTATPGEVIVTPPPRGPAVRVAPAPDDEDEEAAAPTDTRRARRK